MNRRRRNGDLSVTAPDCVMYARSRPMAMLPFEGDKMGCLVNQPGLIPYRNTQPTGLKIDLKVRMEMHPFHG